jgi:hypothetical protein
MRAEDETTQRANTKPEVHSARAKKSYIALPAAFDLRMQPASAGNR